MNKEHKVLTNSQVRWRFFYILFSICLLATAFAWLVQSPAAVMIGLIPFPVFAFGVLLITGFFTHNLFILNRLSAPGMCKFHECLKSLPEVAPMFSDALSQGLKLRQRDLNHIIVLHRVAVARQAELKAVSDIIRLGSGQE